MGRKPFLDISDTYCLRGIAMLLIIVGHTFNGYPANSPGYYSPSWMNCLQIGLWGGMGVGVFLFLDAFFCVVFAHQFGQNLVLYALQSTGLGQ